MSKLLVDRNSGRLGGIVLLGVATWLVGWLTLPSYAADRTTPSLEALAIEIVVQEEAHANLRALHRTLSKLQRQAKHALRGAASLDETRERFNRFFFKQAGFTPEPSAGADRGLLLHDVLERRQGGCVGLVQAYLILGMRLGLPVSAAATPTHLFARWSDGRRYVNVELLENGSTHANGEYQRRHRIREPDPANPVFLRDLGPLEVAARIHNNLGTLRSRSGSLEQAALHYVRAIELDPKFPAPHYNRGLDHLNASRLSASLADFNAALAIHPSDPWALNNRALTYLRMGDSDRAVKDLRHAMDLDPEFHVARVSISESVNRCP